MKVAVTGSSGFIGQRLVRELLARGNSVLAIDKRSVAWQETSLVEEIVDILDQEQLVEVISRFSPDYVVHLAARTDLDEKRHINGYAANIEGVKNLVSAVQSTQSVKRCIFTSSQLVCKVGYVPKDEYDYDPNTLYGESKVLTEKIVRSSDGGGVEWCLVRPTTVWGPDMLPHYQRLFRMISKGTYFHVGHKPLHKSYSYIGNIACQYIRLLEAPVELIHRRTFYLADYQPLSLREWTNAFQKELSAKPIWTCPEPAARMAAIMGDVIQALGVKSFPFTSFRLNNVLTEYIYDLSDTERICGPLPYTMEEGVKETVAWLVAAGIVTSNRRHSVSEN